MIEPHKHSSTQVDLPPEVSQRIIAFGHTIPDHELAEDGREEESHVTLKYGLHSTDPQPVAEALTGEPPVHLSLGKTSLFKSPKQEVLIIEVNSPDLNRMNKKVEKSGPYTDTHPGYHAHSTIAYLKPGEGDKYSGLSHFSGIEATIPSVTFLSKDGSRTEIPLTGTPMPKKMKYQRAMARAARNKPIDSSQFGEIPAEKIPHEAVTDAPNPLATEAMAAGGFPIARGNSNETPLTDEGKDTVARTGAALAALGGPDQIISSPSTRATETAAAIQGADPKQPPISVDPGLESQAHGNLEGEAKSPGVRKFLDTLVRKHPDYRIPGQGAMSSQPGESFNDSRIRILASVRGIMQALAQNPNQSIAVPKHTHVSKMVKGWIANGMPDDLSVSPEAFLKDDDPKPGEVEKFAPDATGSWKMDKFDPEKEAELPKGAIYFIEHGQTPATTAMAGNISASQRARAEFVQAVRAGDWGRAKKSAVKSTGAGLLSDADVEEALEEALPSLDDAIQMEAHQLLPIVSAAGPEKRAQMLPVLREKLGDMSGASPMAVSALRSHLGRLGA